MNNESKRAVFVAAILPALLVVLIIFVLVLPRVRENRQETPDAGPGATPAETVDSFESCVAAGNPIMESYPRQCATADGRTFTEAIDTGTDTPMVGADRDEHGCIGSAGYMWCAPKEKCLRVWEEPCYVDLAEEVAYHLADKYDRPVEEVRVTVTGEESDHASGGVVFGEGGPGEGGVWLARRQGNMWEVVFDGNGSIDCGTMRGEYGFPDSILQPNFCD